MPDKLIGKIHIGIIQDEKGEVKFDWGYQIDDDEIRLNDLAMINSFLDILKEQAEQDFRDRLEINDKEFSIESKKEGQNGE
jgi:hypothetical protein